MSDSYNYNFFKMLTEQSIDIVDTKTLLTYGMIGVTCVVLGVATIYDEIDEQAEELEEAQEENIIESVLEENLSPSGEKSPDINEVISDKNGIIGDKSQIIGDKSQIIGDKSETAGGKKAKKNRRTKRKVSKK